jgi:hypothetical protein
LKTSTKHDILLQWAPLATWKRERELMHTLRSWPLGLSYCTVSIPTSPVVCNTSAKLKILLQHSTHLHRIHTGLGPLWFGGPGRLPRSPAPRTGPAAESPREMHGNGMESNKHSCKLMMVSAMGKAGCWAAQGMFSWESHHPTSCYCASYSCMHNCMHLQQAHRGSWSIVPVLSPCVQYNREEYYGVLVQYVYIRRGTYCTALVLYTQDKCTYSRVLYHTACMAILANLHAGRVRPGQR